MTEEHFFFKFAEEQLYSTVVKNRTYVCFFFFEWNEEQDNIPFYLVKILESRNLSSNLTSDLVNSKLVQHAFNLKTLRCWRCVCMCVSFL